MFAPTDIVRRTPLNDIGYDKRISPGIRSDYCALVDVRRGVLPYMPNMHPTRVFHKGTDRAAELTTMKIVELIAPDIYVPMTPDHKRGKHRGVYMRFIRGKLLQHHGFRFNTQQRYDLGCIGVLDALISNGDRHEANAIVTRYHVYPIDHGNSWGMLSRSMDFPASDIKDDSLYAGVCATLERCHQYADNIAQLMSAWPKMRTVTADDITAWAADCKEYADGERAFKFKKAKK